MARQRMLSPKFFTDARICMLPPLTRILFQGLWGEADREGRLVDSPVDLKIRILPMDAAEVESMLAELDRVGLIQRYEVDGRRYVWVCNFAKNQHPHHLEAKSTLPAPPKTRCEPRANPVQAQVKPGANPTESVTETESITESVTVKDTGGPSAHADEVFAHWVVVTKKTPRTVFGSARQSKVEARLREGYSVEQLKLAVDGCAVTPHNQGETDGQIHDDLELICRSAGQVDRFIRNAHSPPKRKAATTKGPIDPSTQTHVQGQIAL